MRQRNREWRVRYRREGDRWARTLIFQTRQGAERYQAKLLAGGEVALGLAPLVVAEIEIRPTGNWVSV